MKFTVSRTGGEVHMSHPSRGAWIEIVRDLTEQEAVERRTPHGVRGLKSSKMGLRIGYRESRTPHGVRGLK